MRRDNFFIAHKQFINEFNVLSGYNTEFNEIIEFSIKEFTKHKVLISKLELLDIDSFLYKLQKFQSDNLGVSMCVAKIVICDCDNAYCVEILEKNNSYFFAFESIIYYSITDLILLLRSRFNYKYLSHNIDSNVSNIPRRLNKDIIEFIVNDRYVIYYKSGAYFSVYNIDDRSRCACIESKPDIFKHILTTDV